MPGEVGDIDGRSQLAPYELRGSAGGRGHRKLFPENGHQQGYNMGAAATESGVGHLQVSALDDILPMGFLKGPVRFTLGRVDFFIRQ